MESYLGESALFLGNGIHRTEKNNGISWGDLLKKISWSYGIDTDLDNDLKPFPLAFEEMLYAKLGRNDIDSKLRNLKHNISEILLDNASKLIDNEVHKGFMQCGIKEIITTNYDYNLESSVILDFSKTKNSYSISNKESKHSLYRGYLINDVKVRHIHGELRHNRNIIAPSSRNYSEQSIMIGFEHYSEYFAKIQSAIQGESGKQKEAEKKSVLARIRDNETGKVWTDMFFTHKLIFAGFTLDFSENHLWWLLFKREELKRKNKYNIEINNEIVFCIPKSISALINYNINNEIEFNQIYKLKVSVDKNKGISDILKSLNIRIDEIYCSNYKDFYLKVIDRYKV